MKRTVRYLLQAIGAITVFTTLVSLGLLFFAGHWMRVDDAPVKSDYILPLAGDINRTIRAAELYTEGYAPILLYSNAVSHPPTRWDRLSHQLGYPEYSRIEIVNRINELLGAGAAKIESFGNGHVSTVEEAEALKEHFGEKNPHLLLVTSPYHARRAKIIFENVLSECKISVATTENGAFTYDWWKDQQSAQLLVMELSKTLHYMLGGAYRSTD